MYFILSSVFYVIVAVCQLLIKDFLILILILYCNKFDITTGASVDEIRDTVFNNFCSNVAAR